MRTPEEWEQEAVNRAQMKYPIGPIASVVKDALAERDALIDQLTQRIAAASEVLGRAAERGRLCARCREEVSDGNR